MLKKRFMLIASLLVIAGASSQAFAKIVSGAAFEKQMQAERHVLELRGAGLLRYMAFIKAYAGALYLPEGVPVEKALADVPKCLEVEYFQPISGKDFGPVTSKAIAQNVSSKRFAELQDRIEYHNSLYEDVRPGDRYSLTYTPGKGTVLSRNGVPKGTIKGADFAAAIFSIWLGPNPVDIRLKKDLLGMR